MTGLPLRGASGPEDLDRSSGFELVSRVAARQGAPGQPTRGGRGQGSTWSRGFRGRTCLRWTSRRFVNRWPHPRSGRRVVNGLRQRPPKRDRPAQVPLTHPVTREVDDLAGVDLLVGAQPRRGIDEHHGLPDPTRPGQHDQPPVGRTIANIVQNRSPVAEVVPGTLSQQPVPQCPRRRSVPAAAAAYHGLEAATNRRISSSLMS